jgi:centromere/kinetochore protein ZW10
MWLAEQLRDFSTSWTTREDLDSRARNRVKLETEIQVLERFGKRAYANEMSTQRTIINDLLGGTSLLPLNVTCI